MIMAETNIDWKKAFEDGEEIILATSSKDGIPRAIVVTSLGFYNNKLLIGICQMKTSFENLKENNNVSLVAMEKGEYYYRANGKSEIHSSGEYFDVAVERSKKYPPLPHHVLVIDIQEVFDLGKLKRIF
jgi:uncharacterized pyridoxamine 5'-phosphate oxidase family protein